MKNATVMAVTVAVAASFPVLAGHAQDALTPERTESLAHALTIDDQAARQRVFGPGTNRIVADGDAYRVSVPLDLGRPTAKIAGDDLTLRARPLDGQRWFFDQLSLPKIMTIKGPKTVTVGLDTTGLAYQSTVDTSHATEGATSIAVDGAKMIVNTDAAQDKPGAPANVVIDSGKFEEHDVVGVATDGRLDETATMAMSDVRVTLPGTPGAITLGRIGVDLKMGQLSPERLQALQPVVDAMGAANAAATTAPTMDGSTGKAALSGAQREASLRLISALGELLRSIDLTYAIDDFVLQDPKAPTLRIGRMVLATAGAAVDGKLDARQTVEIHDFSMVPNPLPASYAGLVPHRLIVTPHVTGASTDAVATMLARLVENPDAGSGAVAPLLATGPVHVALDALSFDVGPATVDATGSTELADADLTRDTYTADVSMTGLAKLQAMLAASSDPTLNKTGVQALVFAKGIGKQVGDAVSWHVDVRQSRVFVNGTDLRALMPHR